MQSLNIPRCSGAALHHMRALLKGLGTGLFLIAYVVIAGALLLLPAPQRTRRSVAARTASFFARLFLVLLGIRVHAKHRERFTSSGHARLFVANHVSYLDVLVLSSLVPSVFITSVELKNTLVLGALARLGGCLYVERRTPSGLKREIAAIARALGEGTPVALFPEGTTSNGDHVHPFKNSLFDAAIAAQADIHPVCFRYRAVNNTDLNARNRDLVYYYGGVTFLKHFGRLLALTSVEVEVVPLKTITVHASDTRKDLAARAHDEISRAYQGE
jgi:1-acyl-sn-glycerol-3-phosphate acyltransferase